MSFFTFNPLCAESSEYCEATASCMNSFGQSCYDNPTVEDKTKIPQCVLETFRGACEGYSNSYYREACQHGAVQANRPPFVASMPVGLVEVINQFPKPYLRGLAHGSERCSASRAN
jgi:hypothetical protein